MPQLPNFAPVVEQWWKYLGFGQRLILFQMAILRLISYFSNHILNMLYNQTLLVQNGQYWRLFTAPLFSTSFLEIIASWFFFQLIVNPYEATVGSAYFIFDFFFKSFLLESINFLVNIGLCQYDIQYQYTLSYGIDGLALYYLCSQFLASPHSQRDFNLFSIPNYYLLLTIPFVMFLYTEKFIYIFALWIAIFEWFFFNGMLIRLSDNSIEKLSFIFGTLRKINCFKQPSQSLQEPKLYSASPQVELGSQQQASQAFGGRGIMIGGYEEEKEQRVQGQNNYQQI
ncbi:unnamed protein product (macronuclear) [Paramecium tetraurelia]|uniref:Derlin n=1 Tax=Paramecium tetraurelia TaxID=5888 RepID=A0D8C3_PARTE|nr:uncharacterized protein GSPATT00014257001 [Paramecium tetraurelia]CAK79290.1 unnamed protein product [Paramecium tetraurelia]|eukprot:XP_001446687.1 hypothetical protein (macronuclear) [Paramecium tetraurelia strain d4-2]